MDNLSRLQKQHLEIRKLLTEFNSLLNKANTKNNAEILCSLLGRISGKITYNHTMEKRSLYQYLLESNKSQNITVANKFLSEMESILKDFNCYRKKFRMVFEIKENYPLFKELSEKAFRSIKFRLDREDKVLYPLLEGSNFDEISRSKTVQSSLVSEDFASPLRSRSSLSLQKTEETYHQVELTSEQLKLDQPIRISLVSQKTNPKSIKSKDVSNLINELNEELKKKKY